MNVKQIFKKVLGGETLLIDEAKTLINPDLTDLKELVHVSGEITRRYFDNKIDMCAIYPAKVGLCSGDCAFCAQSVYHNSNVQPVMVEELNDDEIIANAQELRRSGVRHYSLVTSGEHLTDNEFAMILNIIRRLRDETKMQLCASLGSLTKNRASQLKNAGVSRYHHNIETSRSFFPAICTTHSYEDKIKTLEIARQESLEICCGGIFSMGETAEQRVEMAFSLKQMDVDCVPINILNPIPGTRLGNHFLLSVNEILRTIAVFRLILQDKPLKFAGGRENALGKNEYDGYTAGINSMIVGNYLTTAGKSIEQEIDNLSKFGLELE